MKKQNILGVIAHPDDLELMAGGTIARWVEEGHNVHVLTFTDGVWTAPDGRRMRESQDALREEKKAADFLGYTVENLGYPAMDLVFHDNHVLEVLQRIDKWDADLLLCPWCSDTHHDHEVVARITISASRRVPRVMMGQINYYLNDFFKPNIFVDISDSWDKKIDALKFFTSQWERAGPDWIEYLDSVTRYYGKITGVERAEGFVSKKFLI